MEAVVALWVNPRHAVSNMDITRRTRYCSRHIYVGGVDGRMKAQECFREKGERESELVGTFM